MSRVRRAGRRTFHSLQVRNFRLFFAGQLISAVGTWMQQVAQAWLVLRLTGSGVALGVVTALQFAPLLLGGAWAGVWADRVDKRRLLLATSSAAAALALVLGVLTATGVVEAWMVGVMAVLLGVVTAVDNPARRAFVTEMVGTDHTTNATSLVSASFTSARVVGPAIAGLLIAGAGLAWCFVLNAASFAAVIAALAAMRTGELQTATPTPRRPGQLREGLHYAWSVPELRLALAMTAVIGTFAYNQVVILPLMATEVFDAGAGTFGVLYAVLSVGSVAGALAVAHRARVGPRFLVVAATCFAVTQLGAAIAPVLAVEYVVLVGVGAAGMVFIAGANALIQVTSEAGMRGRVAALFSIAFLGSTPIGAPIAGLVSEAFGPRAGLALGALATGAAALVAWTSVRRAAEARESATLVPA